MTTTCVVLMYHVIDRPRASVEARLCCPPESFTSQLRYLRDNGYTVLPLSSLVRSLREGTDLPRKSAVITFDDGSSCLSDRALPILSEFRFPATVFMVSGLIGRKNEWLHGAGFPDRRMLNAAELRSLNAGGVEVGSHTVSHPRLTTISPEQVQSELKTSKTQLEDAVGRPVVHFAYPFGNHNDAVRDAVADAGYFSACSTRWGRRHTPEDLFTLRRVEVQGGDSLLQFALKLRIATNHMPPIPEARHLLRQSLEKMGILARRPPDDTY